MRLILTLLIGMFLVQSYFAQQRFTLNGSFEKIPNNYYVYYPHSVDGKTVIDSTKVIDNKFTISDTLTDYKSITIYTKKTTSKGFDIRQMRNIVVKPNVMELKAKKYLAHALITGSDIQIDIDRLNNYIQPEQKKLEKLNLKLWVKTRNKKSTKANKVGQEIFELKRKILKPKLLGFARENANRLVGVVALLRAIDINEDYVEMEEIFNLMPPQLKETKEGSRFDKLLTARVKTKIGAEAPSFTLNDTSGKPINLSDYKGKYVLIDFWASWCSPCRAENPNLITTFEKFKDKNFTILGVSLDMPNQKEKWLKAIQDDKLPWIQVSDLNGWQNTVANSYGITAIPQSILVNPEGVIVAKNLRGTHLTEKLAEIFK